MSGNNTTVAAAALLTVPKRHFRAKAARRCHMCFYLHAS